MAVAVLAAAVATTTKAEPAVDVPVVQGVTKREFRWWWFLLSVQIRLRVRDSIGHGYVIIDKL